MRILVTGATGFVGTWLIRELEEAGHATVAAPPSARLDVTDEAAVRALVEGAHPHAIAHLAAVSYAGDAARDPERAIAVNERGTAALLTAAARIAPKPLVLVSGSSEVYGSPRLEDLPLDEDAPLRGSSPYGRSKLAQERVALVMGARLDVPVVVTRSFNHTGPGQRTDFVTPALAARTLEARAAGRAEVSVGNLEARRDIGDVRDVVRAYRLLVEGHVSGSVPSGTVVNVATGRAVSMRSIFESICRIVGVSPTPVRDPALLRAHDPPVVVGDASKLVGLTGWAPEIQLEQTLRDLVDSLSGDRET